MSADPTSNHDLRLVRSALAEDPSALEELVHRLACIPAILRDRARRLGAELSSDDLADASQNTLLAVWKKLDEYDGRAALETWAYGFAVFELLSRLKQLRGNRERQEPVADLDWPGGEHDSWTDAEAVDHALRRLGPPWEETIRLKHFEDLKFREIGERLSEPHSTIMTRYYRGLERLRDILGLRSQETPR